MFAYVCVCVFVYSFRLACTWLFHVNHIVTIYIESVVRDLSVNLCAHTFMDELRYQMEMIVRVTCFWHGKYIYALITTTIKPNHLIRCFQLYINFHANYNIVVVQMWMFHIFANTSDGDWRHCGQYVFIFLFPCDHKQHHSFKYISQVYNVHQHQHVGCIFTTNEIEYSRYQSAQMWDEGGNTCIFIPG